MKSLRKESRSERIDEIEWETERGSIQQCRKKGKERFRKTKETSSTRKTKNDRESKRSRGELTKYSGRTKGNKAAVT